MGKIKVWTRQHSSVLKTIQETGRYVAKKEYITIDMQEHADIIFEVYDWLVKNGPDAANRPQDVQYPVWVSFDEKAAMLAGARALCWNCCLMKPASHLSISQNGALF